VEPLAPPQWIATLLSAQETHPEIKQVASELALALAT
jgi:hypothetical protein